MTTCPDCKGVKTYRLPLFRADDPSIDPEDERNYETRNCSTCHGAGEIGELKAAVYKARGGAAPTKYRPG